MSRFWAQYDDESTASDLRQINRELNSGTLLAYTGPVEPGEHYAAPYVDANGTSTYRVRVIKLLPKDMLEVYPLDEGVISRH